MARPRRLVTPAILSPVRVAGKYFTLRRTSCILQPVIRIFALLALVGTLPAQELDIHYTKDQALDLYLPASKGFTTIVYTYGGGWHSGSGKSSQPIAEQLTHLGYACALVSHRLFPPDAFPAPAEDLAAAFAWVKANIAARGGDPKRVILAGHSSGAHLSLLIATDQKYLAAHHLTPADIPAVIGLSTPVDLSRHPDGHGYGDVLLAGRGAGGPRRRSLPPRRNIDESCQPHRVRLPRLARHSSRRGRKRLPHAASRCSRLCPKSGEPGRPRAGGTRARQGSHGSRTRHD
ncbi:hypothetical protein SBA3_370031 [Candidatus Sulfopaludibacter sp. SbA3]|nr:hypothetical protein SBA3_370031 [Candidatus Sulfopaludibacter sp. SbA3]